MVTTVSELKGQTEQQAKDVQKAYEDEKKALSTLITLRSLIAKNGFDATLKQLKDSETDYKLTQLERSAAARKSSTSLKQWQIYRSRSYRKAASRDQ